MKYWRQKYNERFPEKRRSIIVKSEINETTKNNANSTASNSHKKLIYRFINIRLGIFCWLLDFLSKINIKKIQIENKFQINYHLFYDQF